MTKALASLLAASLVFAAAPALAQEQGHEGHDPAGASDSAKPQSEVPATKPDQGKMQGGMMGKGSMMGGNCKMMREMGGTMPKGDTGPSSQAYNGIMMKMHNEMAITYSGNADIDFMKGMIPHHQAAVDMAKTVMAFGRDPEVKKLAEDVIKAQEAEITQMKTWLQKNGAQ